MMLTHNNGLTTFRNFTPKTLLPQNTDNLDDNDDNIIPNELLNCPFTLTELKDQIKSLKNDKATGVDGISNEMIKCSSGPLLGIILDFFNINLAKSLVSASWCKGIISPIHKEGDKSNPENFRGICIMNSLLKPLCMMLYERIANFLKSKNTINKSQIGFMRGNRSMDHILTLKSIVNKYVNETIYMLC